MTVLTLLRRPAISCLRSTASSSSRRTFTSLLRTPTTITTLQTRPTLHSSPTSLLPQTTSSSQTTTSTSLLLPLQGLTQTRGHRRKTYNPSHIVRKRRFGFLARLRSKTGKNILKRRKAKGRKMLTH
ncbi:hypothetical protein TWF106_005631 [Orbilia oligospora]|uniref:Large ribosomal subunit protein bL34m n=1 Tax=Orbilia oligospora TaxID=2813651 RepID=A0A6G1LVF7_ORBOL|nr:hypothetical protein TWF106_005631 [Orbilia oligospora]KAF3225154.1 hypothetical protein TWF191_005445 [Orbilia oligospora]KAF3235390.1 hypothetical protein TWF192_000745 [Orbilia oligospora]